MPQSRKARAICAVLAVVLVLSSSFVLLGLLLPGSPGLSFGPAPSQYNDAVKAAPSKICSPPSCKSTNWSGYAISASNASVSDVKGSWLVPALSCTSNVTTFATLWVGIDGLSSNTVEQTGILEECNNGVANYSAWYEFYPNPLVNISTIVVKPNDTVSAEVNYSSATGNFTVRISDGSNSSFTTSAAVSGASRSSAEWIVERPLRCSLLFLSCTPTTLANFGTAYFGQDHTSSTGTNFATVGNSTGSILSFGANVVAITMALRGGRHSSNNNNKTTLAQPSSLASDGMSFTVTYG